MQSEKGKAGDKCYVVRWGRGWGRKAVTRPAGITALGGEKGVVEASSQRQEEIRGQEVTQKPRQRKEVGSR